MNDLLKPANSQELQTILADCLGHKTSVQIIAGGSKQAMGIPSSARVRLDLSNLSGLVDYAPEELLCTAQAATPMKVINQTLTAAGQRLDFDPPDFAILFGHELDATLGGVISVNHSGSRRLTAGAARDHLMALTMVSGRAEQLRAGAKVVKNVTGYDLCKLLAGSWGTLGCLHEVTVKTAPILEHERSLFIKAYDSRLATRLMVQAMGLPFGVVAAAWLPQGLKIEPCGGVVLRFEGRIPSGVASRLDQTIEALRSDGSQRVEVLEHAGSAAVWQAVRDVHPFAFARDQRDLWRISLPPSTGGNWLAGLAGVMDHEAYLDWGGGLVWLATDCPAMKAADLLRKATGPHGHVMLVRASEQARRTVSVFHPVDAITARLQHKIKAGFDPEGILNPGQLLSFS